MLDTSSGLEPAAEADPTGVRYSATDGSLPAATLAAASSTLLPEIMKPVSEGWLRWWRSAASYPVYVFALSRLLFVGVTYGALALLHSLNRLDGLPPAQMVWSWHRWDAVWFTRIAAQGYPDVKTSAFFPLLPLLMRIVGTPLTLFLAPDAAYFIAGMLIANAALLGALLVLHRSVAQKFDAATAQRAVLYLALFPKALFTFTAYSESLFLLLAIASYVLARRGRFGWAALLAALATLDRLAGVALLVPIGIELWARYRWDIKAWLRNGWVALGIPLTLIAYAGYLALVIGDPLGFMHAESAWGRHFTLPPLTLANAAVNLLHLPFGSSHEFNRIFDLSIGVLWLVVLGYALLPHVRQRWHIPASLLWLGIALTLLPLSDPLIQHKPDLLSSLSRYLMAAFPVFIIIASLTRDRPRLHEALLVGATALLVVYTTGFVMGYYVV